MQRSEDRNHWQSEATGDLKIRAERGLHAPLARRLAAVARGFEASATLRDRSGRVADARSLFELLLLEATCGDAVTLQCIGTDADGAFTAIAAVLTQEAL
jgi:phosphotransferase system HPr (HPr) family protein